MPVGLRQVVHQRLLHEIPHEEVLHQLQREGGDDPDGGYEWSDGQETGFQKRRQTEEHDEESGLQQSQTRAYNTGVNATTQLHFSFGLFGGFLAVSFFFLPEFDSSSIFNLCLSCQCKGKVAQASTKIV